MNNENPTGSDLIAHAIAELDRIGETSPMRECVLDDGTVIYVAPNQRRRIAEALR